MAIDFLELGECVCVGGLECVFWSCWRVFGKGSEGWCVVIRSYVVLLAGRTAFDTYDKKLRWMYERITTDPQA